jgi:hypothetical protein
MATQAHINDLVNSIVNSYTGDRIGYHGGFSGECTSPVKYYVEAVTGRTAPYMANDRADGWGTNFPGELAPYFTHEVYQPGKAYPRGTILTWNSPHIAMVLGHDGSNTVTVFEQNADPEGSPCKTVSRIINNQWHTCNYAFVPIIEAPVAVPVSPSNYMSYTSQIPTKLQRTNKIQTHWWNLSNPTGDINNFHPAATLNVNTEFPIGGYATNRNFPMYRYAMNPDDYARAVSGDYSTNNGINVSDLEDIPAPPPYVPPAAPLRPVLVTPYPVIKKLMVFETAEDAKGRRNYTGIDVEPGDYIEIERIESAVLLSKDNKTDIGWINTFDNKIEEPKPVEILQPATPPAQPTLPVDAPPTDITIPVDLPAPPVTDMSNTLPTGVKPQYNWIRDDRSAITLTSTNTVLVQMLDLEGKWPPQKLPAKITEEYTMYADVKGVRYYIMERCRVHGWMFGVSENFLPRLPKATYFDQDADGRYDIVEIIDTQLGNFIDFTSRNYQKIQDVIKPLAPKITPVTKNTKQFIDGVRRKGNK